MSARRSDYAYRSGEEKKAIARNLQKPDTPASQRLWQMLRKRQLGYRFSRSKMLQGWVPDFYCSGGKLAIEIDYGSEEEETEDHTERDAALLAAGIRVLRIESARIFRELEAVLAEIADALEPTSAG